MRVIKVTVLFVASVLAFAVSTYAMATVEVDVQKVVGKAEFRTDTGEWKPLTTSVKLQSGHEVRTGPDGEVILVWFRENVIKIASLSTVKIDAVGMNSDGAESSSLNLSEGRIVARAKKLNLESSRFDIRTPIAVCGVRGTSFTVGHDSQNRKSSFVVVEGRVVVTAQDVEQMIEPGHRVNVEFNNPPGDPIPVREEDMQRLRKEAKELDDAVAETGESGEDSTSIGEENDDEIAEFVADDAVDQVFDNLLIDHITAPSDDCCNY